MRRGARRTSRRTSRRTVRRVMRRRRRRRVVVGGMVLLAVSGTATAIKLSQQDAQRIEQHTGASVEELEDHELTAAMQELGIQSAELTAEDKAALAAAPPLEDDEPSDDLVEDEPADGDVSYIEELQKLAGLRDQGIITQEEFEAKKKQLLEL
jgi:hypothetical protein